MSILELSCGHASDRLFHPISKQGFEKWKGFKKKYGKIYCSKFKELGLEFKEIYFLESEPIKEDERTICPECYSEWRDNT